MRVLCLALAVAAVTTVTPIAHAQINPSNLTITGYQLVSQTPFTQTKAYFTYRADVVNTGPTLGPITATVSSSSSSVMVVPGQGNLHFAGVPHNAQISSSNGFTILVDRSVNFSFNQLQWSFDAPVADAGPAQTVPQGSTVNLTAAASTNPSGIGTLTYSWTLTTLPPGSSASIQNPSSVTPTFIADAVGNFVASVAVSNGAGTDWATVTISTTNSGPVANAGANQTVQAGATVHLDGSKSNDVDGDPITYSWTLTQLPPGSQAVLAGANTVNPTFVADLVGSYTAQLVVNDGTTNSAPAFVTITTTPGNTPPVANAGSSQVVTAGATVQLDGSKSTDVDGDTITYSWQFNQIPPSSAAILINPTSVNPTFVADLAGTYIVQLTVNDGHTNSVPSTVTITTTAVLPPTANAGQAQTVLHGAVVTLNGSGTDPQNLPLTYHWSLIHTPTNSAASLSNPALPNPTFVADLPGTFIAQLIVNNGVLNSAPSTVMISTTNTPPLANAGTGQTVAVGSLVTLDGSGSSDADHDPITYKWSILNAPGGSTASLSSATAVGPTFTADVAGMFVLQLIVNDGFVDSAPSTVTINANAGAVITLTPNPFPLFSNAPATLTVSIGTAAPSNGLVVTLTPFDTTIISAPSTVTIPANGTSTTATITPLQTGGTLLFASAPNFQPGNTQVTVNQPGIGLNLGLTSLGLTKSATGTVTLSGPAPSLITVNLTQTGPGSVTMPASIDIPAGQASGTFQFTGATSGQVTISASAAGYTSGPATVTIAGLGAISLASGATVAVGASTTFSVTLLTPAPVGGATITLQSSDTTKLTISPSVFIAGGATTPSTPAQITGVSLGTVNITASSPGFSGDTKSVQIATNLSMTPNPVTIAVGGVQNITLTLGGDTPQTSILVNLSANGLGPVNFPATETIPAGINSISFGISGASAGSTTITASTSVPGILSGSLTVTVVPNLSITTASPLPNGAVGAAYSQQVNATGGVGPYTFSATGLPNGLAINSAGLITGTPTATGTSTAQVTVTDSTTPTHLTASSNLTITINASVSITTASLPNGVIGTAYSAAVTATGGSGPYTFSATGLPSGLSISAAGQITGTPSASGTTTAQITATDSTVPTHLTATANLAITISPALSITTATLPTGILNSAYTATVNATGGNPAYTFSATGLPAGLSISAAGAITGTPSAAGTSTPQITVTDSTSPTHVTATANLSITINASLAITTNSLPTGVVGSAYNATVAATGGNPGYTFSATGLPNGLSISAAGAITGTPTAAGTASAQITVTDSTSPTHLTATANLSITINASLSITTASLPAGVAGTPYSATVAATGGNPGYTFSATGLPNGLSVSAAGAITGTPSAAGTTTAQITVTDSTSPTHLTATANLSITINAALSITTASLSNGAVGVPYSATVNATGGNPGYTFSATGLPSGLSISAAGAITGTPSAAGTTTAQITVTDSTSPTHLTATANLSITINASLAITTNSLPSGVMNVAYSATVNATGGTPGYTFSATGLPNGLSISAAGAITGTPSAAGTSPAQITVTDSSSPTHLTATANLSITINASLAITTVSLPNGVAGTAYSASVAATGGTPGYTFSATGLPNGLSISAAGAITGTPSGASSGTAQITVTDSTSPTHLTATANLSITISAALTITTASLPNGVAGAAYNTTVAATGGNPAYTFSATGLPNGLSISAAGQITGTPSGASSGTAHITVTDSTSPTHVTASANLSITISAALSITTASLPNGVVGTAYNATVAATGGNPGYTFSATGLPGGLSISAAGAITGTPSASGVTTAQITVTDSTSPIHVTATANLSITISQALSITTASLPNGVAGTAYGATVSATGGSGPYSFSATGLPGGLSISTAGQITGTPGASGTSTAQITVTDSTSPTHLTATANLSITINAALSITTASLPNGVAGVAYSATVAATGGNPGYTFSATGLPNGLSISAAGAITGTPSGASSGTAQITVTDSTSPTHLTATANLSITINAALAITTASLPNGVAGTAYSATVAATGGNPGYTFSATGLPNGLSISAAGAITGTPSGASSGTAQITVTDSTSPTHLTATANLSITISAALTITTATLPNGVAGTAYNTTVAATGGNPAYTFTATGLPNGLSISAAGQITGTPSAASTGTAHITVTDSTTPTHVTATANLSITINAALSITTNSLVNGVKGSAYSATVAATGGNPGYTFSATGLPAGLSISAAGAITGTPSAAGPNTVQVTVTDSTSPTHLTATANLSLLILTPVSITTTSPLPTGTDGVPYSASVSATGGTGPYTFSASGLPAGLAISVSGQITGTPTVFESTTITVTVVDSSTPTHLTAQANLSLTINPPAGAVLGITGGNVGQNLQTSAIVTLTQPSSGTLNVTISSNNPAAVALGAHSVDTGTGSLTIQIAAGVTQFSVFVQGLANSGSVTLTASAPDSCPAHPPSR